MFESKDCSLKANERAFQISARIQVNQDEYGVRKMYSYFAYGLGIQSLMPLPELKEVAKVKPDLIIRRGEIDRPLPTSIDRDGSYFHLEAGEAYLFWKEVGAFLVRNGNEIIVDAFPGVEERIIRLPLLGTVLSAAISQRNLPALHASAVAVNGQAVAFLGFRGAGKSTMAAALYSRGHSLIADDSVVLDINGPGIPTALPSFPQLKLFPEAASASLGDDPKTLPQLMSGFEKRGRRVTERFSTQPVPLSRLYILDRGTEFGIEPIPTQERFVHLFRHSYVARIFSASLKGPAASSHFLQCVRLAGKAPVYRLKRPFSLAALPDAARMVEEDLEV